MKRYKRNLIAISDIDIPAERLSESLNALSQELKRQVALCEYNKQNLKIGDEVEYKGKFWIIEALSESKENAKLTAPNQQSVLANLSRINDYK